MARVGMGHAEFSRTVSGEIPSFEFSQAKYRKRQAANIVDQENFAAKKRDRVGQAGAKNLRLSTNTGLGTIGIAYSKWLAIINLFELPVSANEAARQVWPRA